MSKLLDPDFDDLLTTKLYRYEDSYEQFPSQPSLMTFKVIRETEKSYLIDNWGVNKWVRQEGTNCFAWDTKEKAIRNYLMRKRRQIKIYEKMLNRAKQFRRLAALIIDPETKEGSNNLSLKGII